VTSDARDDPVGRRRIRDRGRGAPPQGQVRRQVDTRTPRVPLSRIDPREASAQGRYKQTGGHGSSGTSGESSRSARKRGRVRDARRGRIGPKILYRVEKERREQPNERHRRLPALPTSRPRSTNGSYHTWTRARCRQDRRVARAAELREGREAYCSSDRRARGARPRTRWATCSRT